MAFVLASLLWSVPAPQHADIEQAIDRLLTDDAGARRKEIEGLVTRGSEAVTAAIRTLQNDVPDLTARVADLVRALSSRKWRERHEATQALASLGRHAKGALESHGNAGDPEVAWRVKAALTAIDEKAGREQRMEDLRVRTLCMFLGEAGDARGVEPLLRILRDAASAKKPVLRLRCAESLAKLRGRMNGAQAERAAERILSVLAGTTMPLERSRLIKALAALRSPLCIRPLSALLRDRSEKNLNLKRACLAALAATGSVDGVKAVVDGLVSDQIYVREGAAMLLDGLIGTPSEYDPRASLEKNRAAIEAYRSWWGKRYGKDWRD